MYNYTTTSTTILGDLYTPVGAYLALRDLYPQSVLMESSDYHNAENSRSFIGINPIASVAISHGKAILKFPDNSVVEHEVSKAYTSADAINEFLDAFQISGDHQDFCGLYGYTSFNAVRYFEDIAVKDETQKLNDAPDMYYILFGSILAFDHHNNRLTLVTLQQTTAADASSIGQDIFRRLNQGHAQDQSFNYKGEITSPLTDEQHKANIREGIRHCLRGDVFQIVLSRRFCQKFEGDDFRLYRELRSINPSPYLFYFDFGGFRIFGSSPETHCRITRSVVETEGQSKESAQSTQSIQSILSTQSIQSKESKTTVRSVYTAYIDPIAGTTRRTGNDELDRQGAEFLRNDPKENAEHVMLVDLARNDLSRNCHDVHVVYYKDLQYYSHVIHLVSRVAGTLNDGADPIKAFIDTFPAGTLSGAPKVRAMQIISELEPHNRGAYGGCVGFIGFNRTLNQAITIRTFVSRNNELWFQAGGGIVAKSNEDYELQEVNNKLGALRKAIESAARQ